MNWLSGIFNLLTGGGASKAASGVVNTAAVVGAIAALSPLALWFIHHKDETALTLSWMQLFFILSVCGGFTTAVVKIAHYLNRPEPRGWIPPGAP